MILHSTDFKSDANKMCILMCCTDEYSFLLMYNTEYKVESYFENKENYTNMNISQQEQISNL